MAKGQLDSRSVTAAFRECGLAVNASLDEIIGSHSDVHFVARPVGDGRWRLHSEQIPGFDQEFSSAHGIVSSVSAALFSFRKSGGTAS